MAKRTSIVLLNLLSKVGVSNLVTQIVKISNFEAPGVESHCKYNKILNQVFSSFSFADRDNEWN